MEKVPVSIIIPTLNEEKTIDECLQSVLWAEEIIVVDGGSSDRTREIAAKYAADVMVTENAPAETQRLKGLARAKHSWFFLLDADERVSRELGEEIRAAVQSNSPVTAYRVLRLNLYQNRPVHLHHPDYQQRLFRKEESDSLPERIHRIPKVRGKVGTLKGTLHHHFFTGVEEYLRKWNFYTTREVSYWRQDGRQLKGWRAFYYLTFRPFGRFVQYYFLKKGILDGFFGFFYSALSAYYDLIVAARFLLEGESRA